MRILAVSSFLPFPATRYGGSKRLYYLLHELSLCHELSLIAFDGCFEPHGISSTKDEFPDSLVLSFNPNRSGLHKLCTIPPDIRNSLVKQRATIDRFITRHDYDACLACYTHGLSFLRFCPTPARRVYYLEDDLWIDGVRREAALAHGPILRAWKALRYEQTRRFYGRALKNARAFVTINARESGVMSETFPHLAVRTITYGIPVEEYRHAPIGRNVPALGFIGNFRHTPNLEAMVWFVREVWPLLRGNHPNLRLHVVGANLPPRLAMEFSQDSNIHHVTEVEGLAEFYSGLTVFVNPIVSGGGLRTKLVEAAAYGRPIVSTALGAEGLEDLQIEIGDTPAEFASKVMNLVGDYDRLRHIAETNRRRVESDFSLKKVAAQLERILVE